MKLSPALAHLAANPWAMEFELYGRLSDILVAHAAGHRADPDTVAAIKAAAAGSDSAGEPGMSWLGRTAVVPMRGALARYASSVNGFCQPEGRSAEAIQGDLLAAASQGAERIVLRIDSPGGEVAGTAETAALVRQISASGIPVIAFVDGLAASAAYWIASQCDEIIASSSTAKVGSIGVAMTIGGGTGRQTVVTSAPGKAGQPLNDDHLANARALVTDLATAFADSVAAGRGLSADQAANLATGEVWTSLRAVDLDLVDRVASWDQFIGNADIKPDPAADARRRAIGARIAANVTVTKPATAKASAETEPSTPAAAAALEQEPSMALDPKKLAALAADHPTHAGLILAEAAKDGASEASIVAAVAQADASARAKAHADIVAAFEAEKAAHVKTAAELAEVKGKHDALAALAKGAAKDPGSDDAAAQDKAASMTQAEYDAAKSDPARAQSIAKQIASGALRIV